MFVFLIITTNYLDFKKEVTETEHSFPSHPKTHLKVVLNLVASKKLSSKFTATKA